MISRRCATAIANMYEERFSYTTSSRGNTYGSTRTTYHYHVDTNKLYDFLYDRAYEAWFCNKAQNIRDINYSVRNRAVKEYVMKLHTGETLASATPDMSWEQREKLGQRYLQDLAQNILEDWDSHVGSLYRN